MVPENKAIRCPLKVKFKVTTKGLWNAPEDKSLEGPDGERRTVFVGGSKHSAANVLVKPSMPVNSSKRRQEMTLDSQKWKKQKMDLPEDRSPEGTAVQRDTVSIGGSKCPEANVLVKPSMPVNSGKRKSEMSLSQRWRNRKMDCHLKLECSKILKELMNQRRGWVFSQPVDPVELKIPDYFQIIKNPMDLGTIKQKLEGNVYSYAKDFAEDVKLTFENAKLYNGPSHEYYHLADKFNANFSRRWKTLEAKPKPSNKNDEGGNFVYYTGNNGQDTRPVLENNHQVMKPVGLTKAPIHDKLGSSTRISLEKSWKSRAEVVQLKPGKIGLNGCLSLGKTAEKEHCNRSASASANLRQSVDSTEAKCSSCLIGKCHCRRSVAVQTSDSRFDCKVKCTSTSRANSFALDLDCPGVVHSVEKSPSSIPATTPASVEGWRIDVRMSPRKALRAAMLKSRFADTILKATQPALVDHVWGEKSNLSKMQKERQRLEKEKARIEAQIEAAERREQDYLKMRRERERLALEKIEQTVEMDNKASLPGGTGYPDYNILVRFGLRIRDDEDPFF